MDARGAHGLAVFASSAADLFEVLRLSEPVDHDPVIADAPFIEPLSAIGAPERWCVLLVNRRVARLFCGPGAALEEVELIEDALRRRHDQGGWSQANYQRSIDKDVADHLRHAAEVAFAHLKRDLPVGMLIGAPAELASDVEGHLHPYLRERLAGRLEIDVEHTSRPTRCAAPRRRASSGPRGPARTGPWRGWPRPSAPAAGARPAGCRRARRRPRAARGDPPGRRWLRGARGACPTCGWLGAGDAAACPADGSAVEHLGDVVEAGVERSLTQAAEVRVLRDRAELASHGHVAAVLRF